MLYMIIEHFKEGPIPVYRRFRDRGRMAPDGLQYVGSWVTSDMRACYQVMETAEPALLHQWMDQWKDLVEFEIMPVMTSSDAAALIGPRM